MSAVTVESLGRDGVLEIFSIAEENKPLPSLSNVKIIGALFQELPVSESETVQLTAARLGKPIVNFEWSDDYTPRTEELLQRLHMVSTSVDTLLTSYIDRETFAAGHKIASQFHGHTQSPLVNLRDDVYANQEALTILLGAFQHLDDLDDVTVGIVWTFGSVFHLPNVAHSLTVLGSILGANVRVISPSKFPLLRRVIKTSQKYGNVDVSDSLDSISDVDVLIPLNWCRIDDFSHPERNPQYAEEYREWYISESNLPDSSFLVTQPWVQQDVSVSSALTHGQRDLGRDWYNLASRTLSASIQYINAKSTDEPLSFI